MPYVSKNYKSSSSAPVGQWTCSPTSKLGPFSVIPTGATTKGLDLCGQCVSYVKKVVPSLPQTSLWKRGAQVKGNKTIKAGTVIATFNAAKKYYGHAAIYVSQDNLGIKVYDQWVTGRASAVGPRILRFGAQGNSNNGDNFYVVD